MSSVVPMPGACANDLIDARFDEHPVYPRRGYCRVWRASPMDAGVNLGFSGSSTYISHMSSPLRARYVASRDGIVVPGARESSLLFGTDENLHAILSDLSEVSLTSLVRAIREFSEAIEEPYICMYFYDQEPKSFNPDVSPRLPFNLECSGDRFWVRAQLNVSNDQLAPPLDLLRVLTPLLARHQARPMRSETQNEFGLRKSLLELFLFIDPRNTSAGCTAARVTGQQSGIRSVLKWKA